MELRQLRYFVTLAEELHFGRAAIREHIVQSAVSQQIQRLERELGVPLLERSTHHVALTASGAAFLVEARQILAHVERSAAVARGAAGASPTLRVGIIDAGYDSMPQILHEVQARHPDLVIHQIEAGVPDQYRLLIDGRLDVGIGRAALAPPRVASLLFRKDPLGVLVPRDHRFAVRAARDHVAAANRAGVVLPVVHPVAGGRQLRPRAHHRQLRAGHVPASRLAGHHRSGGAVPRRRWRGVAR